MINICTVADRNYFLQGLALFESLKQHASKPFMLHFLCINTEDYIRFNKTIDGVQFYDVNTFIENSKALRYLRDTNYKYFCWSLASFFSYYLLEYKMLKDVLYIDSDICFYKDVYALLDKFENKNCAIFRHRQFNLNQNVEEGLYNVGVIYFSGKNGSDVCGWWVDAVLNKKYSALATCGDQKYIEMFQYMIGSNNMYIDGDVGHGAPWLWQLYDLTEINKGYIIWNNVKQDYFFTHFSQFKYNINNNTFIHSKMHECYTMNNRIFETPELNKHYLEYFNLVVKVHNMYNTYNT
jgi:hypothetical protein